MKIGGAFMVLCGVVMLAAAILGAPFVFMVIGIFAIFVGLVTMGFRS